jgi:hypothetical protein
MDVDALPEEAVLTDEKPAYFYYTETPAEAQTLVFKRMNVKTGYEEDGYVQVELENPIPPAGRIVTKGTYFIKSVAMRGEK